jgi:Outer membrane protein beta-barrel domain
VIKARPLRLASLALTAAAFSSTLVVLPDIASADRVRVRGGGHVRVGGRAHVRVGGPRGYYRPYRPYRPHSYRPYYRPRVHLRYYPRPYFYPGFYWGFRYASPPPCYYECGPSVSAYYYGPPRAPVAVAAPAVEPEPPLARLGIGVFGGSVDVENNDAGADLGLIGRLRLTRHLMLEAEFSKTELADGERVDKRLGGALLLDFMPYSALSPYVLGGGGFGQTEVNDGEFSAEQAYGELGAGLEWRLGRHIALFGDLRAGVRESNASDDEIMLIKGRPGGDASVDDNERFTRARIGALLYF